MKHRACLPLLALAGGVIAALSPPAAAADVSFESRTYLPARGAKDQDTHVLLYEYLSFDAEELRPGLYLRAGGWGRTDLADETYDRKTNGDLQYAYVGWRAAQSNAEARAGRISLAAGVARNEIFDGLVVGGDLPAGFDLTLYGGVPVEVDEDGRSGDSLYGGRLSQGRAGLYRIGASYLKEQNDGNATREEAGADLFLAPLRLVQLTGTSTYDVAGKEWAQHDYRLTLGPFADRVRLVGSWTSTDYEHFFTAPKHPAFVTDEPEQLDKTGGELEIVLGRGFTLNGEYFAYRYKLSGDANAYGGGLDWALSGRTAGVGYRKVHGDEAENQYQEAHAYLTTPLGPVRLSASGKYLWYEEEINGKTSAGTGALSLIYDVSRALELSASVEYGQTTQYDPEVRGLLALLWRYDAAAKKGGTK